MSDDQSNFNDQTESKGDDQCFLYAHRVSLGIPKRARK